MKKFLLIIFIFFQGCVSVPDQPVSLYKVPVEKGYGIGHFVKGTENWVQVSNIWYASKYIHEIANDHCLKHSKKAYFKKYNPILFRASYNCYNKYQIEAMNKQVRAQQQKALEDFKRKNAVKTPSNSSVTSSEISKAKEVCYKIGYKKIDNNFKTCVLTIIEANSQNKINSNNNNNEILTRNNQILNDLKKAEDANRRHRQLKVACRLMGTCRY